MRPLLHLKLRIKHDPLLFSALWTRIRPERPSYVWRKVRPGDEALVEGYPRSANTFAAYAFQEAQGRSVRLGGHYHNPAQFVLARRHGVPAMLLLRQPLDAALSFVLWAGCIDPHEALVRYITFHRPLLAIADGFVVAPFDEVTTDFGRSIGRLNRRFGTSFSPFRHDKATQQRVFDRIQADYSRRPSDERMRPMKVNWPTAEKAMMREGTRAWFDEPSLDPLKMEAQRLYEDLLCLS